MGMAGDVVVFDMLSIQSTHDLRKLAAGHKAKHEPHARGTVAAACFRRVADSTLSPRGIAGSMAPAMKKHATPPGPLYSSS